MANRDVIADLVAQISLDGTKFQQGIGQVNRQLKTVQEELKTARSHFKRTGNEQDLLGNRSRALSKQLKLQETSVELLSRAYQESKEQSGEFSKNTQNLERRLIRAKRELSETESELKDVNEQLRRQPNRWKELGQQAETAGTKMMSAGRTMTSFGQSVTMGVTAPILAAGASVFKLSTDWETAFTGVEKTVDATEKQLSELEQGIRDMAKEIPASTTEIAAVAEAAGQLGIQVENIEDFTRVMIDLGNTTNLTADQAATTFARFANIVGMSQGDFDKLGAVVVDLGNNLATTEAEITEMALRLAGAGAQIGLAESDILAFSAALSSVGIRAEAGGSAFSKVMVQMQLAAESGGEELENFAKVAGVSSNEFKKAFEEDASGAIISFVEGLSTAEERGLSAISILDEMGIKEVILRDTLLRAAGASDVFTSAIKTGSSAWAENTALTEEAGKRYETTASQLEVFWNRVKDTGITLGESLVPALMDALDVAEPLIEKIESGVQAFADMTEEEQRTILKLIGVAAAIGPVSVGLGGLTTTIGGIIKIGGALSSLLGRAGGAGLLGRIAGLGLGGPVGVAIGAVTTLGGVIYALNKNSQDLHEVNFDLIDSINGEIKSMDGLSSRFEELHSKNKLTSDEMLRYMDIMDELAKAKSGEAIGALSKRQEELLKKSGMTNSEMEEFLKLNDTIVENTPNVTTAISDQGNAYIDNLETLKELNSEKREELLMNAQRELEKALDNENQLLEKQRDLNEEIRTTKEKIAKTQQERLDKMDELEKAEIRQKSINDEIKALKDSMGDLDNDALIKAESKLELLELEKQEQDTIVDAIGYENQALDETYDKLLKKLKTKNNDLETTREEIKEIEVLQGDYEALILAQAGITSEKGKGLEAISAEIERQKDLRTELEENTDQAYKNTLEYEEAKGKIDDQIDKLRNAQRELEEINRLARETVYKDVVITPSIADVKAKNLMGDLYSDFNADGTDYFNHPSGLSWLGEEGNELVRHGNKWVMADFGLYKVPHGAQIFTNDETNKILRSLNNIPGHANGANPTGEADRIATRLNQPQQLQGQAVIYTTVINQMDSRELGRHTHKSVTEFQNRSEFIKNKFRG